MITGTMPSGCRVRLDGVPALAPAITRADALESIGTPETRAFQTGVDSAGQNRQYSFARWHDGAVQRILARAQKQRSILAKAVFALAADPSVRQRILDNARTGSAALWLVAPTRDRADHLVVLLADYGYSFLRYYGDDGVADVQRDADERVSAPCSAKATPPSAANPSPSRLAVPASASSSPPAAPACCALAYQLDG